MTTKSASSAVSGKLVLLAILALGLAAATFAWLYNAGQQQRSLEFWGTRRAELIMNGPRAEVLRFAPAPAAESGSSPMSPGSGRRIQIAERQEVTGAPGFSHIRNALLSDSSFVWKKFQPSCQPRWEFALRFSDSQGDTTVFFDLECPRVAREQNEPGLSTAPILAGLKQFFRQRFPQTGREMAQPKSVASGSSLPASTQDE